MPVEEEGNGVKDSERSDRQPCAAIEPLQLLALQRRAGYVVTAHEEAGGEDVKEGVVKCARRCEPVLEQRRGLPEGEGIKPQAKQRHAGSIDQRKQPAA